MTLLVRDAAMIFHVTFDFLFLFGVMCVCVAVFHCALLEWEMPWVRQGGGFVSVRGQLLPAEPLAGSSSPSQQSPDTEVWSRGFAPGLSTADFLLRCTQTPFPNHPENFKTRHSLFMEAPGVG